MNLDTLAMGRFSDVMTGAAFKLGAGYRGDGFIIRYPLRPPGKRILKGGNGVFRRRRTRSFSIIGGPPHAKK